MSKTDRHPAGARLSSDGSTVLCTGTWTVGELGRLERVLQRLRFRGGRSVFDLREVRDLDMAGAWLLHCTVERLRGRGVEVVVDGLSDNDRSLLELVAEEGRSVGAIATPQEPGFLEDIGRASLDQLRNYVEFLSFIGHLTFLAVRIMLTPAQMYWAKVVEELEEAGFDALPIVGLLSFLIGVVIAYQGGVVLRPYGGSIFIADLVGMATVRELAPLITAIIVAGRTGSAYTAQIGTMVVTEEVDALRSMGIVPLELLVLPKLFALAVALPLLTVFADMMGIAGGMFMASAMLDVSYATFIDRLAQAVDTRSFLVGIGKAPVFAGIIAAVGSYQGFKVSGGAESVGRHTTICVVQCIFLVIVVDALFSIVFSRLGI